MVTWLLMNWYVVCLESAFSWRCEITYNTITSILYLFTIQKRHTHTQLKEELIQGHLLQFSSYHSWLHYVRLRPHLVTSSTNSINPKHDAAALWWYIRGQPGWFGTEAPLTVTFCCMHPSLIPQHRTAPSKTLSLVDAGLCWRLAGLGSFGLWRLTHWISGRRRTLWRKEGISGRSVTHEDYRLLTLNVNSNIISLKSF